MAFELLVISIKGGYGMIIFAGNDRFAYRDPACWWHKGTYYLFFTVSEKENGYMFNRLALSLSHDLKSWSPPRMLTPKDLKLNFCSPGNIIEHNGEFILCFTSYPMPFPYASQCFADQSARLYIMRTYDFQTFSQPEKINAKGDIPVEEEGRMIDPYILPVSGGFYLFFKQHGVSLSISKDLMNWSYLGRTEGGENACVLPWQDRYLLVHSPATGIAFSVSKDLKQWTEYGFTTLEQEKWPWAAGRLTAGFLMRAPQHSAHRYILFFHASKDIYPETHGNATLAYALTDDLKHFYYD